MDFSSILRPVRADAARCLKAREEYLRARTEHQQGRTRAMAQLEAKISDVRSEVFRAGDGVVRADMTALEKEWLRVAHTKSAQLDLERFWAQVVPERWRDLPRRGEATLDAMVTLASDPEGVEGAERAVSELAARLVPFGVVVGTKIDWMVSDELAFAVRAEEMLAAPAEAISKVSTHEHIQRGHRERIAARDALRPALEPLKLQTRNSSIPRELSFLVFNASLYRDAGTSQPPSPFEPALEIYLRGYALTAADEAHVVLTSLPLVDR